MKYLFHALILLMFVFPPYFLPEYKPQKQNLSQDKQAISLTNSVKTQWETKTDEQFPVTIKITPIEFGGNLQIWKFAVTFDTHSGSLDEDPTQITTLIDDKGGIYKPIAWEGPGPGGHHREGVLVFDAINPTPEYVELNIKNIGGIPSRLFKWDIK